MQIFSGLMRRTRRPGRDQVTERAARVIDKAMFDVGIDAFVNGTVMLDEHLRPRFFSASARQARAGVATVILSDLDEARALQGLACTFDLDAPDRREHSAALLHSVICAFQAQSAAFRALR